MKTTIAPTIRTARVSVAAPLLPQVTALLPNRYLAGKQAYDFIGNLLDATPAMELQSHVENLGLSSIATRDLDDPVAAALAVAAAAILDASKGVRATVSERLELAMGLLDSELSAGW